MSAPLGLGQFRGTIVRWGSAGFGFIECAQLRKDAYFKESWVIDVAPAIGVEVEFDAAEYPGDKIIAKNVRAARGPGAGAAGDGRMKVKIRGLESLPPLTWATPRVRSPAPEPKPSRPTSLAGIMREAVESQRARVAVMRTEAASLEATASAVAQRSVDVRAEAQRRRAELERQIVEAERAADRKVEDLVREAGAASLRAKALREESASLDEGAVVAARKTALDHVTTAHRTLRAELALRDDATLAVRDARKAAIGTSGQDAVRKYEQARRQAREAKNEEDREAFTLLEQKRRQPLRAYAEALDRTESWAAIDVPVWLIASAEDASARTMLVPFVPGDWQGDGSMWRVGSAFVEAIEHARADLSGAGGRSALVENGSLAGFLAVRMRGVETDLLPLLLDDALAGRPTLRGLGVTFRLEEAPDVRIPMDVAEESGDTLDAEEEAAGMGPATGGTIREVAQRLDMTAAELVAALVARGLPFPDDVLDTGTEDSLRTLLGVAPITAAVNEAVVVPAAAPPPELPKAVDVAARVMRKLLRARMIGGKHTRIENVYGHHFADTEKDLAREVTLKLVRLGVLHQKLNVGSPHVSIEPRRLEDAQRLAEGRCTDGGILDALLDA